MTDIEDRMGRQETITGEIRVELGVIKGLLEDIREKSHSPSTCPIVVSLNLAAARQQGALAVIGIACGILGGGVVWLAERLLGR